MRRTLTTGLVALALTLGACAGDAGTTDTTEDLGLGDVTTTTAVTTDTTVDDVTGTTAMTDDTMSVPDVSLPEGIDEAISSLQGDFAELASAIAASDAGEQLLAEWTAAQSDILEALAAVQAGEALDTTAIEDALDQFTAAIPGTEEDITAAWNEVRATLEGLIADIETG
jgi:hypothetical protein